MNKVIDMTDEIINQEPEVDEVTELKEQVESMTKQMNDKLELGRNSLINMLKVTRDKFLTVNGTNHIYQAMLDAKLYKETDCDSLISIANDAALDFSDNIGEVVEEIGDDDSIEAIQKLFMNRFYLSEYKHRSKYQFIDELIAIQMVREIDGTCNDLLEFKKVAEEEIAKVQQKIEELENAN